MEADKTNPVNSEHQNLGFDFEPTPVSEACDILREAQNLVTGDRNDSYGHPAANHGRTAALWSAYLGVEVTAGVVCVLNVLQKLSRERHQPGRDNRVDAVGYLVNLEACGPRSC